MSPRSRSRRREFIRIFGKEAAAKLVAVAQLHLDINHPGQTLRNFAHALDVVIDNRCISDATFAAYHTFTNAIDPDRFGRYLQAWSPDHLPLWDKYRNAREE